MSLSINYTNLVFLLLVIPNMIQPTYSRNNLEQTDILISYEYKPNTYFNTCTSKYPHGSIQRNLECLDLDIAKNIINAKAIAYCGIRNGSLERNKEYSFIMNEAFENSLIVNKHPYLREEIYKRYKEELSSGSQQFYISQAQQRISYIGGCKNLLKSYYPSFIKQNKPIIKNHKILSRDAILKRFDELND